MITFALMLLMQTKQTTKSRLDKVHIESTGITLTETSQTASLKTNSARVDALSVDEYARLQKLRQAVTDAETEIAKAHGVKTGQWCPTGTLTLVDGVSYCPAGSDIGQYGMIWVSSSTNFPDTYEFRGQFLLVNVPKSEEPR